MTKSVCGSFIVQFDICSPRGKELNKDSPTYDGKEVVILQAECYPYNDTIRMLCELIYSELADIICCVLIIAGKENIDMEYALTTCMEKNYKRAIGVGDK